MRIAGISASLCSTLVAAACTTGNSKPGTGSQEGIVCATVYTAGGTFAVDATMEPAGMVGCWPVGTWKITLSAAMTGSDGPMCSGGNSPQLLSSYTVQATATADPNTGDPDISWAYVPQSSTDPNVNFTGKASDGKGTVGSSNQSPLCQGLFSLYDATGTKEWNLTPELDPDDMTLSGSAEYDLYGTDQWMGSD